MTSLETKIKQYLLDDGDDLKQVVNELNSWNGCLDDLDVHNNDEDFFETFFSGRIMEAVRAISYGEYNYSDDYVKFNGYGNLESLSEFELEDKLKGSIDEIVGYLMEHIDNIDVPSEVQEIIDEHEEEKEEEEEN